MTSLILVMFAINAMLVVVMLPRMYGDWLKFGQYRENGDYEMLRELLSTENEWVRRHFFCGALAVALVVAIRRHPAFRGLEQVADVTVTYAILSLGFAFTESLFAQKIASVRARVREGR